MALDVIPAGGIYPGTNLTWSVVGGDSPPTISSSAEGKFGKAIYFDGSSQRVDLGSGSRQSVNLIHVFPILVLNFW